MSGGGFNGSPNVGGSYGASNFGQQGSYGSSNFGQNAQAPGRSFDQPSNFPQVSGRSFDYRAGPNASRGMLCACFKLEELENIPAGYNQSRVILHAEPHDGQGVMLKSIGPFDTTPQSGGYGQQSTNLRMANLNGAELRVDLDERAREQGRIFLRLVVQWVDSGTGRYTRIGTTDNVEVSWQSARPSYFRVDGPDSQRAGTRLYMSSRLMESSAAWENSHMNSQSVPSPMAGYIDGRPPLGNVQTTESEKMARLLEAEPQVMDGVVVCMEFKELTDLPDNLNRHQKLMLTVKPEDREDVELARIGPYSVEVQQDRRYSRVSCQDVEVILPVRNSARLQGKSSRLRIFLSYLDDQLNVEEVGATAPFVVQFEGSSSQRRGQLVKPVYQVRQYKIEPFRQDRARDFALTKVHLTHRLLQEDSRDDGGNNGAYERSYPQRGVASAFYISFDRISDLPGPPYGTAEEGQVVLTVESADSKRPTLETVGPLQTMPQAGGHLHKVACHGKRVVLDVARVQIFVGYQVPSAVGGESLREIGHTPPIDLTDDPLSYQPLCDNNGYQVGSARLYMTHRRFQRGADGQMLIPAGQYGSGQAGPQGPISMSKSTLGEWPQEATKHLESPDGLDAHWNVRSTADGHFHATEPLHTGLKLVAGSFHIPHPDKLQHGAWEKEFMCRGGGAVGIFEIHEATGHAPHMNPTETVHRMAAAGTRSCDDTRLWAVEDPSTRAWRSLRDGLQQAGRDAGAGIVAALNAQGSKLGVAKLGHLVLWQVRKTPGTPVTGSHAKVVAHAGEYHEHSPNHYDGVDKAVALSLDVLEGDLLVVGSDGVFHNLHDKEMCDLMEWTVSPMDARQTWDEASETLQGTGVCTHPGELAAALAKAAFCRSRDEQHNTPYAQKLSREQGRDSVGGVKDDITVVCAWLARTFASKLRD